ncbi:hypothetical protein MMC12_008500 [Toensbergia leucococca]|nr:hypothetical protein [Toensbergia leucococca]
MSKSYIQISIMMRKVRFDQSASDPSEPPPDPPSWFYDTVGKPTSPPHYGLQWPDTVIYSAFQLDAFIFSGHQDAVLISSATRQVVNDIVFSNLTPSSFLPRSASASDPNRRGRPTSLETSTWPSYRAIDKPGLCADIRAFEAAIKDVTQRISMPSPPTSSTGNTPKAPARNATSQDPDTAVIDFNPLTFNINLTKYHHN